MSVPRIFLCNPTHDRKVDGGIALQYSGIGGYEEYEVIPAMGMNSLLPTNFNQLWCNALNARKEYGVTHFAMLHSDLCPLKRDWLRVLLYEMITHKAHVVAAMSPIKTDSGLMSAAWWPNRSTDRDDIFHITEKDLQQFPITFDSSANPGHRLLMNTGMWLADIREPKIESCFFEIKSWTYSVDGVWYARDIPEDWNFSLQLHNRGLRLFCTQRIPVTHWGVKGWTFMGRNE